MATGGKQPGAGRPVGAKNKASEDIKTLCRRYTNVCVEQLFNIAQRSKHEGNRIAAISQILDRGYGKPTQNLGTEDDKPLGIIVRWEK